MRMQRRESESPRATSRRPWGSARVLVAIAALFVTHHLAAQASDTILGTRLLANPVLRPPFRDTLRLALQKRGQYHIAIWPATTRVQVAVAGHPDRTAFVAQVRRGGEFTPTTYDLYPQDDGEHLFALTPVAGTPLVRIWVWEDTTAEVATRKKQARRATLGLSVEAGTVSGYVIGEPARQPSSPYAEGGVLIGSDWLFSLLLGGGNDSRASGVLSVNWAFAELRARLLSTTLAGREFSLVATGRVSQGNASTSSLDPSAIGGGAMVTWHLDHRHATRGWVIGARASWYQLANIQIGRAHV